MCCFIDILLQHQLFLEGKYFNREYKPSGKAQYSWAPH